MPVSVEHRMHRTSRLSAFAAAAAFVACLPAAFAQTPGQHSGKGQPDTPAASSLCEPEYFGNNDYAQLAMGARDDAEAQQMLRERIRTHRDARARCLREEAARSPANSARAAEVSAQLARNER